MATRLPMRLLARHVRCARRNFSTSNSMLEAQNFMMPAMSPTMTEGNISSWKVKEGDSFSAGDILLEIETDKASMDVEAQDDGVVAKIFQGDGTKAVKVGTRIAVLGEAGDDVSSLKIPEDTSSPVQSEKDKSAPAKEESKEKQQSLESTPENQKPSQPRSRPSPTGSGQNPKYPLYPAVQILIHQNHISDEDVKKIPATGPQGRLLKGDVLAYLGTIEADYSKKQSERIEKNGHLDLSNIKILERQPPKSSSQTTALSEQPRQTTVSILISLAEVLKTQARIRDTLNVTMPLSTFLARAVDYANDDLPRPKGSSASQDELFNAVLGLDTIATTSRGTYLPQIDALPAPTSRFGSSPTTSSSRSSKPDILDILSGHARPVRSATARSISTTSTSTSSSSVGHSTARGAINTFTLTVPVSEERRARVFLERMKTILQVEPGRLVL